MNRRGFTLAEVMVAMLFLSIAMFGYIALHMRIIHSSTTLQQRHSVRRKVDLQSALLQTRISKTGEYPIFVDGVCKEALEPYVAAAGDGVRDQEYQVHHRALQLEKQPELLHLRTELTWTNQHGPQAYVLDTYVGPKDKGW